ncbi:MAG: hypothetical protein DRG50_04160 [Deltaproteobacteria bacterium]|nr:MAG: hypothetical protein DRG50_04160 [Deltaproteobacteria bacterium]
MKIFYLFFYPLIGALIGWLTNTIAIWMLFHPYEEKRIWGLRIPFTPGLIPARIERLAQEVSKAIKDHFLSGSDIKNILKEMELGVVLTEEVKKRIKKSAVLKPLTIFLDNEYLKSGVNKAAQQIIERLEAEVVGGKIEDLIRQRILCDFHPQKVEELILNVSKKELKYITYFGGILGGIIGMVQIVVRI